MATEADLDRSASLNGGRDDRKSHLFTFTYVLGEEETYEEAILTCHGVFGYPSMRNDALHANPERKTYGVVAAAAERDGIRVLEMAVAFVARRRVVSFENEDVWRRKGAKGTLCNVRWPAAGNAAMAFFTSWLDATRCLRLVGLHGLETDIVDVLQEADRAARVRMRKLRQRSGGGRRSGDGLEGRSFKVIPDLPSLESPRRPEEGAPRKRLVDAPPRRRRESHGKERTQEVRRTEEYRTGEGEDRSRSSSPSTQLLDECAMYDHRLAEEQYSMGAAGSRRSLRPWEM
ncbi:hypothetical protein MY1884_009628 [Beauveria asiatica]